MYNYFQEKVHEIYNIILQPIDIVYKLTAINNYKDILNIGKNEYFGDWYYKSVENKKEKGIVYTPKDIGEYMVNSTIKAEDIIKNPYVKIADPSCGSGNLMILCFLKLEQIYKENLEFINEAHKLSLTFDNLNEHIVFNNLFGFDTDTLALKILIIDLFIVSHTVKTENFYNKDFLIFDGEEKFDIFIGNPPYIGHKLIEREYSTMLKKLYKELYKDKGDISYCFFGAALNRLKTGGRLSFITSRYFLESSSGEILRKTLKEFCSINKIVDFYGIRPFKNVGIDPVIIFLTLEQSNGDIEIIKPLIGKEGDFTAALFSNEDKSLDKFNMTKNLLNDKGWLLRNQVERTIINKIEKKCFTNLGNICESYQGIITGCDKAFVVDYKTISEEKLEEDIIKPWIKSSFIHNGEVNRKDMFLIYSNLIKDENSYPNSINYISRYKERLLNRRECVSGVRKWYELQWGRVSRIFESEKIVFPYKSNKNRFSMDKGSFFSADVYCLLLKDNTPFTYDYMLKLLNSKVYEYYFKTFAKKLGNDLYEYYPDNLMKLCIPAVTDIPEEADNFLYEYFELTESEINIIKSFAVN